jgi:LacI family transcriptional regulator
VPPVTLQDVADRAGVSLATASRVLNGSARTPRPDVSERVRQAAHDLGYVANAYAQALARSATQLIGLVVHDIADPYFSSIARGVQNAARGQNRQVLLANTDRDPQVERETVLAFAAHRTDAIILAGSRWSSVDDAALAEDLERYRRNGGRVAVIGQRLPGASAVVPENREGAADLAHALVDDGHRRFAVLTGPEALVTASDRTAGFVSALAEHDLAPVATVPGEFTRDGGFAAVQQLIRDLALSPAMDGPLCVFAVNDVMAIGAIAALREAGIHVPDDVQVAGFDDIPTLRDSVPGLTTVRLPLTELGEQAIVLTLGDRVPPGEEVSVRGEVIRRESTRLPHHRS